MTGMDKEDEFEEYNEEEFVNDDENGSERKLGSSKADTNASDQLHSSGDEYSDSDDDLADMMAKVTAIQSSQVKDAPVKAEDSLGSVLHQSLKGREHRKGPAMHANKPKRTQANRKTRGSSTTSLYPNVLFSPTRVQLFKQRLMEKTSRADVDGSMKKNTLRFASSKVPDRIEQLAQPHRVQVNGRKYTLDDEERNCRFQLKRRHGNRGSDNSEDFDSGSRDEFLTRMETAERNRQRKLEQRRLEEEYNVRVDKKSCPICLCEQTYSELRDKKKRCQNCGVKYRHLNAWSDVGREFIARMEESSRQQAERKKKLLASVIASERGEASDKH